MRSQVELVRAGDWDVLIVLDTCRADVFRETGAPQAETATASQVMPTNSCAWPSNESVLTKTSCAWPPHSNAMGGPEMPANRWPCAVHTQSASFTLPTSSCT